MDMMKTLSQLLDQDKESALIQHLISTGQTPFLLAVIMEKRDSVPQLSEASLLDVCNGLICLVNKKSAGPTARDFLVSLAQRAPDSFFSSFAHFDPPQAEAELIDRLIEETQVDFSMKLSNQKVALATGMKHCAPEQKIELVIKVLRKKEISGVTLTPDELIHLCQLALPNNKKMAKEDVIPQFLARLNNKNKNELIAALIPHQQKKERTLAVFFPFLRNADYLQWDNLLSKNEKICVKIVELLSQSKNLDSQKAFFAALATATLDKKYGVALTGWMLLALSAPEVFLSSVALLSQLDDPDSKKAFFEALATFGHNGFLSWVVLALSSPQGFFHRVFNFVQRSLCRLDGVVYICTGGFLKCCGIIISIRRLRFQEKIFYCACNFKRRWLDRLDRLDDAGKACTGGLFHRRGTIY